MAATAEALDPVLEAQVSKLRARQARPLEGREARGRVLMTAIFFTAAVAFALLANTSRDPAPWLVLAFVAAYALVSSIHLEVGTGVALPTELVFVPMLFLLPAREVPLVVAAGMLVAEVPALVRGTVSVDRAAVLPANALFAFGPALVFLAAGEPSAGWRGGAVLVAALAAQFVADFASSSTLEWLALGVRPHELLRPLAQTFSIDLLVAPVAYGIAIAQSVQQGALLLLFPLVALLALFARERRERLDSFLELSAAYRGTALLLGDVVEADDAYTGEHSRQVVELVLAVCDRMSLPPRQRRLAELAAIVHDVGKIRIPSEIINKPGPLTDAERAIVNTHTLEGELLLLRVGGVLGDVGRVVRSCHERWDGRGYPDGLHGETIPLISRIVCCCDAWNAMTTDRPYRRALAHADAVAELLANRGTQFDPGVVDALLPVVG